MVFTAFWSKLEKIMYATCFENVLLCNSFKLFVTQNRTFRNWLHKYLFYS